MGISDGDAITVLDDAKTQHRIRFRTADNFTLATGATITDVHWWGESTAGGDAFTFTFYADNGGTPGSTLLVTSGSLTKLAPAPEFPNSPNRAFYSSDLTDPFTVSPGTTYWLSIFNSAPDAAWAWLGAELTGDRALQRANNSDSWGATPTDVAFQLTDSVTVPEPGTLGLLGLAFAGLGFARRRKLHCGSIHSEVFGRL